MAKGWRRLSGLVNGISTLWGFLPGNWQVALTGLGALVTGYFGWQTGGVFYALIGAALVLAFGLLSVLIWTVLTKLTSVYERLTVEQVKISQVHLQKSKDSRNKIQWIAQGLTLELQLRNHSQRTLYFKINRERHSFGGITTKEPPKLSAEVSIVPPQTIQVIVLATLPDIKLVDDLIGHIELELLYGPAKDDLRYLFVYESTPGMSASIQKNGKGQISMTSPIVKHLHGPAPAMSDGIRISPRSWLANRAGALMTQNTQIDLAIAKAVAVERERCAKIVEGEVYKEHYRKWPQVSADGNRSTDCEITKHCQKLAGVIRSCG